VQIGGEDDDKLWTFLAIVSPNHHYCASFSQNIGMFFELNKNQVK
jgi:hypothetical protein